MKVILFIEFPLQQVELCQQLKEILIIARNFNHILEHYEIKIYTLRYPTERLKSDRNFSFC